MVVSSCVAITKAFGTRIMFGAHSLLVVWRVTDVTGNWHHWFFLLANVLLFIELLYTCIKRKGQEWKWFSPSVFLYLASTVPGIFMLEMDRIERYRRNLGNSGGAIEQAQEDIGLSNLQGVEVPISLSPDLWVLAMEQVLLFVLIIGRWLMPKGDVSHDQLSQLLFVYIAIASDIMDLLILFNESYVVQDELLTYVILSTWSFSLMQFTLVLTATKGMKSRGVGLVRLSRKKSEEDEERSCKCCETEVWSILTAMFMQDGPFMAIRLYVMIKNRTLAYSMLFFTFKNALILGMQFYRLFVVISFHYGNRKRKTRHRGNSHESATDAVDVEVGSDDEGSTRDTTSRGSDMESSSRRRHSTASRKESSPPITQQQQQEHQQTPNGVAMPVDNAI